MFLSAYICTKKNMSTHEANGLASLSSPTVVTHSKDTDTNMWTLKKDLIWVQDSRIPLQEFQIA